MTSSWRWNACLVIAAVAIVAISSPSILAGAVNDIFICNDSVIGLYNVPEAAHNECDRVVEYNQIITNEKCKIKIDLSGFSPSSFYLSVQALTNSSIGRTYIYFIERFGKLSRVSSVGVPDARVNNTVDSGVEGKPLIQTAELTEIREITVERQTLDPKSGLCLSEMQTFVCTKQ